MSKINFGLVGAAGFIAPKHMKAIRDTGNDLVAVVDPNDSVGILDSYFPEAYYFNSVDRFERYINKQHLENSPRKLDYLSICSPNYLHDSHIRMGLWNDADVICEKPLVNNPWNLDYVADLEERTKRKVYTVLQLRLLPSVLKLRKQIEQSKGDKTDVDLTYITRRGQWYHYSWKADVGKSGGLTMNIGIHFFDLLIWLYGAVVSNTVHLYQAERAAGVLELEGARVRWFLSIAQADLPEHVKSAGGYAYRSLTMNGEEFDLTSGFTDLHTKAYEEIIAGRGPGIEEARPSINLVHDIRASEVMSPGADAHPWLLR